MAMTSDYWWEEKDFTSRLVDVTEKTAIPFPGKLFVLAEKRVGAGMLEFAEPESTEIVSGCKNQYSCQERGQANLKKITRSWIQGEEKHSSKTYQTSQSRSRRDILQTFFNDHVKQFLAPTCCNNY